MSIAIHPGKWEKSKICVAADYKESVVMPKKPTPVTAPVYSTSPQNVTLNRNFLLALINPTDDFSTKTRTYFNKGSKINVSVIDPKREEIIGDELLGRFFTAKIRNKEQLFNLKHLPTLSEFKILLALLHYAQQKRSAALEFNSMFQLLNHVGLTEGAYNYNQVFMTLLNFVHLVIQYEGSYMDNFYPRSDSDAFYIKKRSDVCSFLVLRRVGMEGKSINLEFDAEFLEECGKIWVQDYILKK